LKALAVGTYKTAMTSATSRSRMASRIERTHIKRTEFVPKMNLVDCPPRDITKRQPKISNPRNFIWYESSCPGKIVACGMKSGLFEMKVVARGMKSSLKSSLRGMKHNAKGLIRVCYFV
jgi:hypothetical protein